MYTETWTSARPSIEIQFWHPSLQVAGNTLEVGEEFRNQWETAYKNTNKVNIAKSLSGDELVETTVVTWTTKEDFDAAAADPIVVAQWQRRDNHNTNTGIIRTVISEVTS